MIQLIEPERGMLRLSLPVVIEDGVTIILPWAIRFCQPVLSPAAGLGCFYFDNKVLRRKSTTWVRESLAAFASHAIYPLPPVEAGSL